MMKKLFLCLLVFGLFSANAQQECKYTVVETGNGAVKSTPEYLMHEKVFGGSSSFIFFSLSNADGVPVLNFQLVSKSSEFTKAYCLDKASRIYLQLNNGKIITLMSALDEQCSRLMYDADNKSNIRALSSSFLFTKGSLEELEKHPITLMRVKYSTETVDYTIRKEIVSESNAERYFPESYFITYLKCIK